jgi:hypothetical protein
MADINPKIEVKLKEYSVNIQKLARFALVQAKNVSTSTLSQLLEVETKKIIVKDAKK